jgi:hypothetical protein
MGKAPPLPDREGHEGMSVMNRTRISSDGRALAVRKAERCGGSCLRGSHRHGQDRISRAMPRLRWLAPELRATALSIGDGDTIRVLLGEQGLTVRLRLRASLTASGLHRDPPRGPAAPRTGSIWPSATPGSTSMPSSAPPGSAMACGRWLEESPVPGISAAVELRLDQVVSPVWFQVAARTSATSSAPQSRPRAGQAPAPPAGAALDPRGSGPPVRPAGPEGRTWSGWPRAVILVERAAGHRDRSQPSPAAALPHPRRIANRRQQQPGAKGQLHHQGDPHQPGQEQQSSVGQLGALGTPLPSPKPSSSQRNWISNGGHVTAPGTSVAAELRFDQALTPDRFLVAWS